MANMLTKDEQEALLRLAKAREEGYKRTQPEKPSPFRVLNEAMAQVSSDMLRMADMLADDDRLDRSDLAYESNMRSLSRSVSRAASSSNLQAPLTTCKSSSTPAVMVAEVAVNPCGAISIDNSPSDSPHVAFALPQPCLYSPDVSACDDDFVATPPRKQQQMLSGRTSGGGSSSSSILPAYFAKALQQESGAVAKAAPAPAPAGGSSGTDADAPTDSSAAVQQSSAESDEPRSASPAPQLSSPAIGTSTRCTPRTPPRPPSSSMPPRPPSAGGSGIRAAPAATQAVGASPLGPSSLVARFGSSPIRGGPEQLAPLPQYSPSAPSAAAAPAPDSTCTGEELSQAAAGSNSIRSASPLARSLRFTSPQRQSAPVLAPTALLELPMLDQGAPLPPLPQRTSTSGAVPLRGRLGGVEEEGAGLMPDKGPGGTPGGGGLRPPLPRYPGLGVGRSMDASPARMPPPPLPPTCPTPPRPTGAASAILLAPRALGSRDPSPMAGRASAAGGSRGASPAHSRDASPAARCSMTSLTADPPPPPTMGLSRTLLRVGSRELKSSSEDGGLRGGGIPLMDTRSYPTAQLPRVRRYPSMSGAEAQQQHAPAQPPGIPRPAGPCGNSRGPSPARGTLSAEPRDASPARAADMAGGGSHVRSSSNSRSVRSDSMSGVAGAQQDAAAAAARGGVDLGRSADAWEADPRTYDPSSLVPGGLARRSVERQLACVAASITSLKREGPGWKPTSGSGGGLRLNPSAGLGSGEVVPESRHALKAHIGHGELPQLGKALVMFPPGKDWDMTHVKE